MIIKQELGESPVSMAAKGGGGGRQVAMGRGARRAMDGGEGGDVMQEMDQQDGGHDMEAQDEADDEDKYMFMGVIDDVSRAGDHSATNVEDQLSYDNSASESHSVMAANTPKSQLQPQRRQGGKAHSKYAQGSGSNLRMEQESTRRSN